jgi:hypothetical protein
MLSKKLTDERVVVEVKHKGASAIGGARRVKQPGGAAHPRFRKPPAFR